MVLGGVGCGCGRLAEADERMSQLLLLVSTQEKIAAPVELQGQYTVPSATYAPVPRRPAGP